MPSPHWLAHINVEAIQRLLDAAVLAGVRRLVCTSTTALYGAYNPALVLAPSGYRNAPAQPP